jgi:hypothetical protein
MLVRFIALKDFWSEETGSQYCAGLGYTVRPESHKLRELIPRWLEEGLIAEGGGTATVAAKGDSQ